MLREKSLFIGRIHLRQRRLHAARDHHEAGKIVDAFFVTHSEASYPYEKINHIADATTQHGQGFK